MTRLRKRNVVLVLVLTVLAVSAGGAAFAYWTGTGSGSGAGTTSSLSNLTLGAGTPTANLYPGGQTNVVLTATNTNAANVRIGSLALDTSQGTGGFAVDGGHSSCGVAALTFTTQTNGGSGWTVPRKVGAVNGTLSITLTNALAMSTAAASACQGATFTVYLAAGP
jgi:hypothetical protein